MSERPSGDEKPPDGHLEPTGIAVVAGSVMVGLVGGWLLHPVSDRFGNPPVVSWLQPLALLFVAAILARRRRTSPIAHSTCAASGSSRTAPSTGWCWRARASSWADW